MVQTIGIKWLLQQRRQRCKESDTLITQDTVRVVSESHLGHVDSAFGALNKPSWDQTVCSIESFKNAWDVFVE